MPNNNISYIFPHKNTKLFSFSSIARPSAIDSLASFNVYNLLMMSKTNAGFTKIIGFGSPSLYTSPLEFLTNKEFLNQFIFYFKDKTGSIIKTLERVPICLSKNRIVEVENPNQSWINFCQAIKIKKLPLKLKNQEVLLSQREFDILSLLIKGKTMREIAQILKISPRTVETYMYTAKDKANTFTTGRFLDLFADSLF